MRPAFDVQKLIFTFLNALEKTNPIDAKELTSKLATEYGNTKAGRKFLEILNQLAAQGVNKRKPLLMLIVEM